MLINILEYKEEIRKILKIELPYENLSGKKILVAGASGMIGSALVDTLMLLSEEKGLGISVYVLGRNEKKLRKRFVSYLNNPHFQIWEHNVEEKIPYQEHVDYIIHAASDANPVAYAEHPVEIMKANFNGMINLLEYGRRVLVERILYISSGEMYGKNDGSVQEFDEEYVGYVDYSDPRSCYPSIKRATEVLCQANIQEYGMDIVIVRPCHVYGPTMTDSDTRAASAFLRNVLKGEDILLKSDGSNRRTMCYVFDTVSGMLTVLLCGKKGQAYNIADEKGEKSILEIASVIAKAGECDVTFSEPDQAERRGFNRVQRAVLGSQKLQRIGWNAQTEFEEGIKNTVLILKKKELGDGQSV